MGIDMFLEDSETQSASVVTQCQSQLEAYQSLQTAIQTFAQDTESLQGKAYDSARDFFNSVLLPLAQGGQLYAETLSQAITKLPADYQERVDTKSWREDDLLEKIRQEETMIARLDELNTSISQMEASSEQKSALRQNNTELLRGHHANKRVYETILEDLRAYDPYSATLFDDLDNIASQLTIGLSQVKGSWNAAEGVFNTPSNLSWVTYLSAYQVTKELTVSKADKAFITSLMAEYGFDLKTARLILKTKQRIDKKFPNKSQVEKDYLFTLVMGSFVYHEDSGGSGYVKNQMWFQTAGNMADVTGLPIRNASDFVEWLGVDKNDVKKLRYEIRLQHAMASGTVNSSLNAEDKESYKKAYENIYGKVSDDEFDKKWQQKFMSYTDTTKLNGKILYTNADFAHQLITTATILRPQTSLSDLYGGKNHVENLAGWLGDTTSAAGASPSIGNDDYRADLDTVNITARMKRSGISYIEASNNYYSDINLGKVTRADEFKVNQNYDEMESAIVGSNVGSLDEESMERLRKEYPESYNFIMSVQNGDNNLKDYVNEK